MSVTRIKAIATKIGKDCDTKPRRDFAKLVSLSEHKYKITLFRENFSLGREFNFSIHKSYVKKTDQNKNTFNMCI